jgi:pyruvate/2-oxoglutarate dehydrogenase complex dihydrolipoamide acyltransferase (E2) component
MPKVPIIMPQLGESIAEATIVRFSVEPGATVEADQEIIEVETNKAVMSVTTPCPGVIENFSASLNDTYPIGSVLGYIEASAEDVERFGVANAPVADPFSAEIQQETHAAQSLGLTGSNNSLEVPASSGIAEFVSPRLRSRLQDLSLNSNELGVVPGTGSGGRVTVHDFESYLENLNQLPSKKASPMRIAVADSMRRSWTRPLATIGVSLSLEPVLAHRKKFSQPPGPALYLAKALAIALSETPQSAGRLIGDKIVLPNSIDIGVAVEVEDGVIVPVFAQLDKRPLHELTTQYISWLEAARDRRLPEEAKIPGIATVTNFGSLGITWATPIPPPNHTLIAGLGRGEKRPVWDEASERFLPQILAEVTISFDHRVIDGGQSGRLVQRIVQLMATPDAL